MRLVIEIVRSFGRKLCLGFLLTCSVSLVSAQTYNSPFSSGGMQYSSGFSGSAFDGNRAKQQTYNSGRYSGLSGGRTTYDEGYKLSEGIPKSIVPDVFNAEQDRNWTNDENDLMKNQLRGSRPGHDTQLPIGDPILPLMLMLCGYAVWKWRQSRSEREKA